MAATSSSKKDTKKTEHKTRMKAPEKTSVATKYESTGNPSQDPSLFAILESWVDKLKNLTFKKALILAGGLILVLVVLSVGYGMMGSLFGIDGNYSSKSAPSMARPASMGYGGSSSGGAGNMMMEEMEAMMDDVSLSQRNIAPSPEPIPPSDPSYSTGNTAEDFEIKEYYGTIKTRKLEKTCDEIEVLKGLNYVIFENSSRGENNCNYRFKVDNKHSDEILMVIERLNPENLRASVHTIKRQIDDFTSREEILKSKLESLETVLTEAQADFSEISDLAADAEDIETLSKIINNKVALIERLTNQRININNQLAQLSRQKAEQLDRIAYTFFNINVYEFKIVDFKDLKDNWMHELKQTIWNINESFQWLTTTLISILFTIAVFFVYLFIAIFVVRYGWRYAKKVWMSVK